MCALLLYGTGLEQLMDGMRPTNDLIFFMILILLIQGWPHRCPCLGLDTQGSDELGFYKIPDRGISLPKSSESGQARLSLFTSDVSMRCVVLVTVGNMMRT